MRAGGYLVFFATSLFLAAFCGLILIGAIGEAQPCFGANAGPCDGWTRAMPLLALIAWGVMQLAIVAVLRLFMGWRDRA